MTCEALPAVAVPPGRVESTAEVLDLPSDRACVLTVHTLFRRPVFRDPAAAHAVARLHPRTLPAGRAGWLAWVLMPDHWQGLLVCGERESLAALAGRFKAMTARVVDTRHRVNGWLWERGYGERLLAADESLADAARTLVAAPRRAGLVRNLADYPYWGAAWPPAVDRHAPE